MRCRCRNQQCLHYLSNRPGANRAAAPLLASYHPCTQGYAKPFLSLSFNQRQQLQHAIRKLGQQTSDQLFAYTKTDEKDHPSSLPMELAQSQQNLEQVISNTLKTVSRETNHLLQLVYYPINCQHRLL